MSHVKHTEESEQTTIFGFWVYLMTDAMIFASLFATYAVLRNNTFNGPSGKEIFDLNFILAETIILLISSFTCGMALISLQNKRKKSLVRWLLVTFVLGLAFLSMELYEFNHLINEGHSWTTSAFLSSFFTLVGTHGLHIFIGLIWILFMLYQIFMKGLKPAVTKRIKMLGLYWHFLDVIWIFIFTFVYLLGAIKL
jgi:cytochrome o ubiquinol oxidase subunit 3